MATAMALAACTREAPEAGGNGPVAARITAGVATKATDGVLWNEDRIGVRVLSPTDIDMFAAYQNVGYATTAKGTEYADFTVIDADDDIWFDTDAVVSFTAYAPYVETADAKTLPGTDGTVSGDTSKQVDEDGESTQESVDYLFASAQTAGIDSPTVNFAFSHEMAQLVFNVARADEEVELANYDFILGGLRHEGTFDTTTGETLATGSIVDNWNLDNCPREVTKEGDDETGYIFTAVIFPQSGTLTFTASRTDTKTDYSSANSVENSFHAGRSYVYNVTVSSDGVEVDGGNVYPWKDSEEDSWGTYSPTGIIYPDDAFTLTFNSTPTLGSTGYISIYKADTDELVDRINMADVASGIFRMDKGSEYNTAMDIQTGGVGGSTQTRVVWYNAVTADGNVVTIRPHSNVLDFDTKYYITVDSDAISADGFSGIKENKWIVTTRSAPDLDWTADGGVDVYVGKTGYDADFRTIQRAIYHVSANDPDNLGYTPATIHVPDGTYDETLFVHGKSNLTLKGESMDGTVVQSFQNYMNSKGQGGGNAGNPTSPLEGGTISTVGGYFTVIVESAEGFRMENMTVENTYYEARHYAGALYYNYASNASFINCAFKGQQYTVDVKGYTWFYNCTIEGCQDLFYGQAVTSLMEDCTVKIVSDGNKADGTVSIVKNNGESGSYGYPGFVFLGCAVTADDDVEDLYLSRADSDGAVCNTAYINCSMSVDSQLDAAGWDLTTNTPSFSADGFSDAAHGWKYYVGDYTSLDTTGWNTDYTYCYIFTGDEEELTDIYGSRQAVFSGTAFGTDWLTLGSD